MKKIEKGKICTLSQLQKGQIGKIISLENENRVLRKRLLDMGITQGVTVEIKKIAPLGDPIDISLRGYELCIRKSDMKFITIEVIC